MSKQKLLDAGFNNREAEFIINRISTNESYLSRTADRKKRVILGPDGKKKISSKPYQDIKVE